MRFPIRTAAWMAAEYSLDTIADAKTSSKWSIAGITLVIFEIFDLEK